jgi:hypothetical protein
VLIAFWDSLRCILVEIRILTAERGNHFCFVYCGNLAMSRLLSRERMSVLIGMLDENKNGTM